jgi:polar amino acid transport system substrate-binding protein
VDIARLVADSLGLELNVVPTSWEDWPLGVTSGKYDAAISNITVTKERKEKFDFATYRKDSLGFYVKSTSPLSKIDKAEDIAGLRLSSAPAPTRRPFCWRGMRRTSRRG